MRSQTLNKATQHAAVFVVDGLIKQRCGLARQPWWVADNQAGTAFGKQVSTLQLHLGCMAKTLQVLSGTAQSTLAHVGRHNGFDAALDQLGREYASAHANIPGLLHASGGNRRTCHQFKVLAAYGREHAVMGMNALAVQSRKFHAFFAPLMGTNDAKQVTQRHQHRLGRALLGSGAPGFSAGNAPVRSAAQCAVPLVIQLDQNAGQHACALSLSLAIQMKGVGKCDFSSGSSLAACHLFFKPAAQRHQELAGVLKVTTPQQRGTFADMAKRRISGHGVIGQLNALGLRQAAFSAPQGGAGLALLLPLKRLIGGD